MGETHSRLPQAREIQWAEVRRTASVAFAMMQAGWQELAAEERDEIRKLVSKSRGRPRNLDGSEARRLGFLAGRAARAAAAARPKR
jgi:hypothetical protein